MSTATQTKITIETTVNANIDLVWKLWNTPEHITKWNSATPDWHTPMAQNDLREGGNFSYRMEAKDGSIGFDFEGTYDQVEIHKLISYTLTDGRKVKVFFDNKASKTQITEVFEAESINTIEMQRSGWQSILDSFKQYAESYN